MQPGEADRRVQVAQQEDRGHHARLSVRQLQEKKKCDGTGNKKSGANPGYTGMEGLLNYAYYQTGTLNQFDHVGHLLGLTLFERPGGQPGLRLRGRPGRYPAKGGSR